MKPFHKAHAIRSGFGDPRYHVAGEPEGSVSAFHFGVDIVARDGAPVYSVSPGFVVRRHATSVTIGRDSGRRFGYWHVRPVVRSGQYIRLHQLIGHVIKGWGHVHFADSVDGYYRNPLRRGALTPYIDHVPPTVDSVALVDPEGAPVDPGHVAGSISVEAEAYDVPPILPPPPWDIARIAPAQISWRLLDAAGTVVETQTLISFEFGLPDSSLYSYVYAPGTYQNKPHRPGHYVYWVAHDVDTTAFANGTYQLEVDAADTRGNVGRAFLPLTIANG